MATNRKLYPVKLVGASQAEVVLARENVHAAGESFRLDCFVGKVVAASGITLKAQHSSLFNIWEDTKSVAVTASTEVTSTVVPATDIVSAAAHGLSSGTPIVFNTTGILPEPLQPNVIYYAEVLTAGTLKVRSEPEGGVVDITTAGSGTLTLTKVRAFSIKFLHSVAADQVHLPLRPSIRLVATTGAGDSLQVLETASVQPE